MIFDVPKYSQHLDVRDGDWKEKSCGIVAVKMVLDYWRMSSPDCDELIKKGIEMDGFISGVGWKHKELSLLAKSFGVEAENFDWAKEEKDAAFKKLEDFLEKYPVVASIYSGFNPETKNGHLIVLTGMDDNFVHYNDPDSEGREEIAGKILIDKFLAGWKKRVIVIWK